MAKARPARVKSAPKSKAGRQAAPARRERSRAAAVAAPPKPAVSERKSTYPEAVAVYERGIEALQRRDYETAASQLRSLMVRFPEERELQERAQVYLRVCERELEASATEPRTAEERIVAATVALNAGDYDRTLALLRDALRDDPKSDHAEYMSAVVLCAAGEPAQAVERLRRAIELNPENRNLARQDSDLEPLHDLDAFRQLLQAPASSSRRRKSRNGR
jgi:tetratricopeptide (TPR) repeat protein